MASALYTDVKRKERMSVFQRPLEGLFGLREWEEEGFIPPGPDGRPITDFQPLRTNRYRKPAPRRGRPPRESPLGGEVSETPVKRRGPGRPPKSEDAHPSRRGPGRPRKRWRDEEDPSFVAGR